MPSLLERLGNVILFVFKVIFNPWNANYKPIKALLGADANVKTSLTEKWLAAKIAELQFTGVSVCVVAATVATAFSWSWPDPADELVKVCWTLGLLLSMASVTISTQQLNALNRMSCHPDGAILVRRMLGKSLEDKDEPDIPRKRQLFVFQVPVMLFNFSVLLFLIGLASAVLRTSSRCASTILYVCGALLIANYLFSTSVLYSVMLEASSLRPAEPARKPSANAATA